MFFKKGNDLSGFLRIVRFAVVGIVLGIIIGLVFGTLISYLSSLVAAGDTDSFPPMAAGSFLGMGFGAVIGGISGLIFGSKN